MCNFVYIVYACGTRACVLISHITIGFVALRNFTTQFCYKCHPNGVHIIVTYITILTHTIHQTTTGHLWNYCSGLPTQISILPVVTLGHDHYSRQYCNGVLNREMHECRT